MQHDRTGDRSARRTFSPASRRWIAPWEQRPRLDVLKLTAMAAMLVDHANTICFNGQFPALRAIGRLAFPLFAFVLAYNFVCHTRRPARFIGRLFLWGVVSQLFFVYAFENELLNIFFTLAFGLCYTALFRRNRLADLGTLLAVSLLGISKLVTPVAARLDFGIEGVLLVFVFAQAIETPTRWHAALAIFFTAVVNPWNADWTDLLYGAAAAASLPVIAATANWPVEWRWMRRFRLGFYFFYPAHLFLLKAALSL